MLDYQQRTITDGKKVMDQPKKRINQEVQMKAMNLWQIFLVQTLAFACQNTNDKKLHNIFQVLITTNFRLLKNLLID